MPTPKVSWRERFSFRQQFWVTEDRKWMRILHAVCMSLFCLYSTAIVFYYFYFTDIQFRFGTIIVLLAWGYLLAAIPISFMLYRDSSLRKYERSGLTLFILMSCCSLIVSIILQLPYDPH